MNGRLCPNQGNSTGTLIAQRLLEGRSGSPSSRSHSFRHLWYVGTCMRCNQHACVVRRCLHDIMCAMDCLVECFKVHTCSVSRYIKHLLRILIGWSEPFTTCVLVIIRGDTISIHFVQCVYATQDIEMGLVFWSPRKLGKS